MVAPPAYEPDAWATLPAYTRLVILQQRDHDQARKQAIATHLASLAPYAHAGADAPAASLIAQHYPDEDARLAGTTTAPDSSTGQHAAGSQEPPAGAPAAASQPPGPGTAPDVPAGQATPSPQIL